MRGPFILATAALAVALSTAACGGDSTGPSPTGGEGIINDPVTTSSPTAVASPTAAPPATPAEDCYTYDAQMLLDSYAAGVHAIRVDHGDEIIRVYGGPDDAIGDAAISVATFFNEICYIGRGNSFNSPEFVFEYWQDPSGMNHPNQPDALFFGCGNYSPSDLVVEPLGPGLGWRVRAGAVDLQHFATEADANAGRAVLALADEICYLRNTASSGQPNDITFVRGSGD
jgi:hypothetical protein